MRLRFRLLAGAVSMLAVAAPAAAGAAPLHNRGLSIHAVPNPIVAGEGVIIYGQLKGPDHGNRPIRLYHRINPAPRFTLIGRTRTNALGQYEFTRQEGIVLSNRNWFVRGPGFTHSRTVHERVAALVSLTADTVNGETRHPVTFAGHVTPGHAGSVVALQEQSPASGHWVTLGRARIGAGSSYSIAHAWRVPGSYDVRVLFRGDRRNIAAPSDTVTEVIQQTEVSAFTIATSDPLVSNGQPVTVSGVLDQPGTTTGQPGTSVSLWRRMPGTLPFREVATTSTGADGSFTFANVQSATNELYQVRTTFAPHRRSAVLFEGVEDVLTVAASAPASTVDGQVLFTGNVTPDKAGHVIDLQKQSAGGTWHTVAVTRVGPSSDFHFPWTFGTPGSKVFRARITGGPVNVGSASAPVTVTVTLPPLSALPTG